MKKIILIGVVAFFASCTPKTAEVVETAAPIIYPTTEIAQGKGLYDAKCSQCHKLKVVDKFTTEEWAKILPDMAGKAKLPDNETAMIQEFITWELNN
jgi:nitrate/TMAO reductase-like tetraheme cytochrome c subunit